ncbi:MAG: hypothetical protein JMDDDDMK_01992 [Acidobacteria bacterium]|nr:hypothetical protein [Acidobacteriota bacterium]
MKLESILKLAAACFLTLALSAVSFSQNQTAGKDPNNKANTQPTTARNDDHILGTTKDEEKQSRKAANALKDIMKAPGRGIPQNVFDRAECVVVFPEVNRSGSTVSGRGVVSCRKGGSWSAPVYLNIRSDDFGAKIGPEPTDLIVLCMNRDTVNPLSGGKFTVGADAPAAAGPVGPTAPAAPAGTAAANSPAAMNAQILCYSRSKGKVAGVAMDGVTFETDTSGMRDVYGDNVNSGEILGGSRTNAPSRVMAFSETLSRYTSRQARK